MIDVPLFYWLFTLNGQLMADIDWISMSKYLVEFIPQHNNTHGDDLIVWHRGNESYNGSY